MAWKKSTVFQTYLRKPIASPSVAVRWAVLQVQGIIPDLHAIFQHDPRYRANALTTTSGLQFHRFFWALGVGMEAHQP